MTAVLAKYRNRQHDKVEILEEEYSVVKKNLTTGKLVNYLGLESHEKRCHEARKIIAKDMPVDFEYTAPGITEAEA